MSTTIDEKVVEMRFDNKQFEDNVRTSMTTLEKLKETLNLNGAAKGLDEISAATKNFDTSGMSNALNTVRDRFSALEVVGITALANITNSAVNAGRRILRSLTIQPISQGFQEYELKMGSIQTIMASTGESLKTVNDYLDELNTYSDKTIYSFSDMTTNIGKFTNAGVKLKDAVAAIQGISNEAAVSGANAQEASRAMYNFAQALSAGYVKLIDWKSIENANMATVEFKNQLIETAVAEGTLAKQADGTYKVLTKGASGGSMKEAISATKNFNDSLSYQWMTTNVLTKTLAKYADETTEIGKKAFAAAQDVKTFSMLMDTLKEAAGSGWAQTWELLVGDFEEAKVLWTELSNIFGKVIGDSADFRNNMLKAWKDLDGRKDLIDALLNVVHGIGSVVAPLKGAFSDVFTGLTGEGLKNFSNALVEFTSHLKLSEVQAERLRETAKGLFSILHLFTKAIGIVVKGVTALVSSNGFSALIDIILGVTSAFGKFFTAIDKGFSGNLISQTVSGAISGISALLEGLGKAFNEVTDKIPNLGKAFADALGGIGKGISNLFSSLAKNISAGDIFAALAGGGIFALTNTIIKTITDFKNRLKALFSPGEGGGGFGDIKNSFVDTLNTLHDSLSSFTTGIRVASIVSIAAALGIMASALKTLSGIKIDDIAKSMVALGVMLKMLTSGFTTMLKSLQTMNTRGLIKSSFALILVAEALKVMAESITLLSGLKFEQVAKGLLGLGVGLQILIKSLRNISGIKSSIPSIIALGLLAETCKALANALSMFAKLSWKELGKGLTAMAGSLTTLVVAVKALGASGFKSILGSIAVGILTDSLSKIAEALTKLGGLSWKQIGKGLSAMGGALFELTGISVILSKLSGVSGIVGAATIQMLSSSLLNISDGLTKLSKMTWKEIGKGLTAMGGALVELGLVAGALGKLAPIAGLLGAKAIDIISSSLNAIADALIKFGSMSWGAIGKGLTAMGAALGELTVVLTALSLSSPLGALIGSAAVVNISKGLQDLADGLMAFAKIPWDEAKTGLKNMGLALAEIAGGSLINTLSYFGSKSIATVAKPLGDLADSIKKWKDVSIPEGLKEQLQNLADAIFCFTFDGLAANAISTVAEPLGTLAGSIKKWINVGVPAELGTNLRALASGVRGFLFTGFGADNIAKVAAPLGTLATSVGKWSNVTVPTNIGEQLKSLADGIGSFTWMFMAGFSMSTVDGPLGKLADSVLKWKEVSIPESIKTGLVSLADGLKAFTGLFLGSYSIETIPESIGPLVNAIKTLTSVKAPENFKQILVDVGDGVASVVNALPLTAGTKLEAATTIASAIEKLSTAVGKASKTSTSGINKFVSSVKKLGEINVDASGLATSAKTITSAVNKMMGGLNTAIKSEKGSVSDSLVSVFDGVSNALNSSLSKYTNAGKTLGSTLVKGLNTHKASMAIAGNNFADGLIIGITQKKQAVYNAGYALGQAAVKGEKDGQHSKSPSKDTIKAGKWIGEGLIIGITKMSKAVYSVSNKLGEGATNAIASAISVMSDLVGSGDDLQPVIKPVVDLSAVQNGAKSLSNLFSSPMVGANANINAIANGINANTNKATNNDILSAIKSIGSLGDKSNDTYIINGITYDDGSNVANAVGELVRVARVEGRS